MTIFIPKKLRVGFKKREDTYTKQLAYVIYYDEKGKLRKEPSWESWRDKTLEPVELDNVPTEGFTLNKKVGGYQTYYNMRKAYVRVYDPRGFEFEISVPNLLFILENTTSTKGKGLEGPFVYGWGGYDLVDNDLVLIPCGAPIYNKLTTWSDTVRERQRFKGKDLIPGATYLNKKGEALVYLDRRMEYELYGDHCKLGLCYFFAIASSSLPYLSLRTYASPGALVTLQDANPRQEYPAWMEHLEHRAECYPVDHADLVPLDRERLLQDLISIPKRWYRKNLFYKTHEGLLCEFILRFNYGDHLNETLPVLEKRVKVEAPWERWGHCKKPVPFQGEVTLQQFFDLSLELYQQVEILSNGKLRCFHV